jgi:hypothetical protein
MPQLVYTTPCVYTYIVTQIETPTFTSHQDGYREAFKLHHAGYSARAFYSATSAQILQNKLSYTKIQHT